MGIGIALIVVLLAVYVWSIDIGYNRQRDKWENKEKSYKQRIETLEFLLSESVREKADMRESFEDQIRKLKSKGGKL